jgi:hypothetical protein
MKVDARAMNPELYLKCKSAVTEAREALALVPTTNSPSLAAAACRRALLLCFMLDREINRTAYPSDLESDAAIQSFVAQHPGQFQQENATCSEGLLSALISSNETAGHTLDVDEEALDQLYLPAARTIRLMLDEAVAGLKRNRSRFAWRRWAAVIVATAVVAIAIVAFQWVTMMRSTDGLTVTYFKGMNFEEAVARRVEQQVLLDYGSHRPAFCAPKNKYSARWEGTLLTPKSTNYAFYSQCEGGIRVYIDDSKVIDGWHEKSWNASGSHGQKFLEAGEHKIVVEYFKNMRRGALRLRWAGGPIPDNAVVSTPYLRR